MEVKILKNLFGLLRRGAPKKGSTNAMILFLSFSNIIGNILNIAGGLFVAKWLLPEELGTFNSFTIITGYVILVQLGIPSGLSRELPYYFGKSDTDRAHGFAAVAQFWQRVLGLGALFLAGSIGLIFFLKGEYYNAAGSLVVGVTVWQALYVTKYLKILYRTNRDFNKLSWIKLIVSVSSFLSIVFVFFYGFFGLCIRAGAIALVDFCVTYYWRPIQVRPTWNRSKFRELMRVGLPMYGVANIYSLWPLLQRTIVVSLGGPKALGLFAIANMVYGAMKTVTSSMSSVIYPTMATQWGEGASLGELIMRSVKPFIVGFIVFLVAIPIGWWLLPLFVAAFIPKYVDGVHAAQWMLIVGLLSLTNVFGNVYNVIKNQRDRLKMYISGVIGWGLTVGILYLVKGFTLVIFPIGMVVAFCIMAIINFFHIRRFWDLRAVDR